MTAEEKQTVKEILNKIENLTVGTRTSRNGNNNYNSIVFYSNGKEIFEHITNKW